MPDFPSPSVATGRLHAGLVAALLAVAASAVLFSSLGRAAMEPDESLYALATDQIRATGEWWTLSPQPPSPYFNKPPLYMWLSAITYDWLPGLEFRYRFWSAVFGVIAVVMIGLLGARLFRWEVGLIAGLLLLTNRSFLTDHGARFGGMDAGLTACFATILWLYCRGRQRTSRWRWWAATGVVAGVASLLKPLGGLPMLAVVALHALLFPAAGSGGRMAADVRRAVLAAGLTILCTLVVAAPWYVVNHLRHPDHFAEHLFSQQIAGAVTGDDNGDTGSHGWKYYAVEVSRSSAHFFPVLPAALWQLWTALRRGERRSAAALLSLAGIGWIAAFSLAQKKFLHYAYPAFPALTVAMAAALAQLVEHIPDPQGRERRLTRPALCAFAAGLAVFAAWLAFHRLAKVSDPSAVWSLYQRWEPHLRAGRARLLFADVPHERGQLLADGRPLRPHMMIYLSHMEPAQSVSPDELDKELSSGEPMLVVARPEEGGRIMTARSGVRLLEGKWFTVVGVNLDGPSDR